MLGSLKDLIVVLAIAMTIFHLAKPIAMRFMSWQDFARRRLVWVALTAVGFLSPNFWLYVLFAVPVLLWANRKDSNPIALYLLMLHVIPPVGVIIPILGNNGLFPLDNYRLLALCILLPAAIRYRRSHRGIPTTAFGIMDVLLLAFGLLQVALYVIPDLPSHAVIPDSPSNVLRRAVLFFLDTYLLYFAVSRTCQSRQRMVDSIASFCLASAVMAAIAMFERLRSWLLYVDIISRWGGGPNSTFYLMREGSVRAQVSAGHAIALGFLLAVAFGFWLYLGPHIRSGLRRIGVTVLLWGGLFGTFSRGAWLGGACIYFTFNAMGPRAASRFVRGAALALVIGGLVAISPIGDRIIKMLPEWGKPADMYRHKLAERGWQLVLANPFFGDQYPWPKMEDLRQGEGIIDLVNTYLDVALEYGLVGLVLFLSFILVGLIRVYARARELSRSDPDLALFGVTLIACVVGTLIMIQSSSFVLGIEKMFYVLAGLAASYVRLASSPQTTPAERSASLLQE